MFDLRDEDVYWCTADIGWVTGHSYIVYGPLANGASVVMYEGAPDFPSEGPLLGNHRAIQGDDFLQLGDGGARVHGVGTWIGSMRTDLSSLRLLGTVGEPINPAAWKWYFEAIGKNRCPIVDTWWQTETGVDHDFAAAGRDADKAWFGNAADAGGHVARWLTMKGEPVKPGETGYLMIQKPWPSMLRTIYGDDERFAREYWSRIPGVYFAGDAAQCDKDGYIWVLGRVDDVIKVAGHRLSSMEIESALVSHTRWPRRRWLRGRMKSRARRLFAL